MPSNLQSQSHGARARFWPAVLRFAAAPGSEVGGGKKVAKSSGVVGGGCVCRKVALVSRCSRCGPTLLVRLPTGLVPWTGLRSAGCERWMPTGCNKYAPQKTAGLPGTELGKGPSDISRIKNLNKVLLLVNECLMKSGVF